VQAILFTGIQATGKSSFYRERFFHTHVRINLDMLRTRHRERVLLRACLDALQPFVVDNTNLTRRDRAAYIELARAAGFRGCGRDSELPLLPVAIRAQGVAPVALAEWSDA
jgi:predicted kinase